MTSVKTSSPVVITAAFLLALGSIGVITTLHDRAASSHRAEDVLDDVQRDFVALQTIPYDGIGAENTAALDLVLKRMQSSERQIEATLAELQRDGSSPNLKAALIPYRSNTATLEQIRVAIAEGRGDAADPLGRVAGRSQRAFDKSVDAARAEYQRRASASLWLARFGSAGAILALVGVFGIFYVRLRRANGRTRRLAAENARLSLNQSQQQVIERLALAAEYRDDMTGQHTRRVGDLSVRIGVALGLPKGQLLLLGQAAPLHDVGKIAIPDSILLKPGPLTHAEFEQMKSHTTLGAAMLAGRDFPLLEMAEQIALSHHERWDGHGYPGGRSGLGIPLVGRIVAIADVFDALTHPRPYKDAWSVADAVLEIESESGRQFDPEVVDAFLRTQPADSPESGGTRPRSAYQRRRTLLTPRSPTAAAA